MRIPFFSMKIHAYELMNIPTAKKKIQNILVHVLHGFRKNSIETKLNSPSSFDDDNF